MALDRNGIDVSGIRHMGRGKGSFPMRKIEKKNPPDERQDKDEPPRLSWDPNAPPAPVDVHAFSRRAGEIIARAARAACKGFRRD